MPEEQKKNTEPRPLKPEKSDDFAEGELETVEESLKEHEKKEKAG
jgi:hypothetical protein